MNREQFARGDGQLVCQYDYDDESVLVVDFGTVSADASVDVVDGTVIVVFDDQQQEFDLPDGANDVRTFIRNGVLTIELEAQR